MIEVAIAKSKKAMENAMRSIKMCMQMSFMFIFSFSPRFLCVPQQTV